MKSIFVILTFLTCNLILVYGQEVDSCKIHSQFFKNDSNLCVGMGLSVNFHWLTKNCITISKTTDREAEEIFGLGNRIPRRTVTYAQDTGDDQNYEGRDFDFYWEYGIGFLCDEKGDIIIFPGDYGRIFFKNGVVVNYGPASRG